MPGALPIAGVSAGNLFRSGLAEIYTVAATVAPEGLDSGKVGFQTSVYFDGQQGAAVWLTFDQPYTNPVALNVPFIFGGYPLASGVSGGAFTLWGLTAIRKTALDIMPLGWDSATTYKVRPRVWPYVENGGAAADFPFVDDYFKPVTLNVPFYFGGDPAVAGVTLGETMRFGLIEKIKKPPEIGPSGFFTRNRPHVGRPRVGSSGPVEFLFVDEYLKPLTQNVPFYFGDPVAVAAPGAGSMLHMGVPRARKLALDFQPRSWDSSAVGRRTSVYFYGQKGALVDFNFGSPYYIPNTLNVPFYFSGELNPRPYGFETLVMGEPPWISFWVRYLQAWGFRPTVYSSNNHIENWAEFAVAPAGQDYLRMGQPLVEKADQYILHISSAPFTQWGTLLIKSVFKQTAKPNGILGTLWGTTRCEHFIRYVHTMYGHAGGYVGGPQVIFKNRYVYPFWFQAWQPGTPRVSRNIVIAPVGFDFLSFGFQNGIDWHNVARPAGWQTPTFGTEHWASYSPRYLLVANATPATEWGREAHTKLYNLRQYLVQFEDGDWFKPFNRGFGLYLSVVNAKRAIGPVGIAPPVIPQSHDLYNKAYPLLAVGIPPTSDPKMWEISLRYRFIRPEGWNSLWVSWYSQVYNDAFAIYPPSIRSTLVFPKVPLVFSNLQTIKPYNCYMTEMGDTMIAFRIRTVSMLFGREFMKFGLENQVWWYEQYFPVPEGKDFGKVGAPAVLGPFRKEIKPRWLKTEDKFGYADFKNKIPQAFVQGIYAFDVGNSKHRISFFLQPATVSGFGPDTRFGRLSIKDRKQTLFMLGQPTLVIPVIHRIANANPDLPFPLYIWDATAGSLYGAQTTGVGRPFCQPSPMPDGWDSQKFGSAWIRVQGCVTKWDWPDSQWTFGTPQLYPAQYIKNTTLGTQTQTGKPRFSPHMIYCRPDVPQQYVDNHNGVRFYLVDTNPSQSDPGPWWGHPWVHDNRPRTLYVGHWNGLNWGYAAGGLYGNADVQNWVRRLYPTGIKSMKFGFPEFPTTRKIWANSLDFLKVGEPSLSFPEGWVWAQYVTVPGAVRTQWGSNRVENWIRDVYTVGSAHTQWGNNTPMVHFPRKVYPAGYVAVQSGTAWASYRVRSLFPQGDDSFISEYDVDFFKDQMRVYRATNPIYLTGFDHNGVGSHGIRLATLMVYPYQIQGTRCRPGRGVVVSRG